MITLPELLADRVYREYFITKPIMPGPVHPTAMPWRVYVQRTSSSGWAKREFHTYIQAFKFLKPLLSATDDRPPVHDAAIQSKGIAFGPPARVVKVTRGGKPKLDEQGKQVYKRLVWLPILPPEEERHQWCTYCRRPTVFRWFSRHHAFPRGTKLETPYQRCTICGASERLVLNYA